MAFSINSLFVLKYGNIDENLLRTLVRCTSRRVAGSKVGIIIDFIKVYPGCSMRVKVANESKSFISLSLKSYFYSNYLTTSAKHDSAFMFEIAFLSCFYFSKYSYLLNNSVEVIYDIF